MIGGVVLLVGFAVAPLLFPNPFFRTAMGDLVPLAVVMTTTVLCLRNAIYSRGHARLFWSLMTAGMLTWALNQVGWVWYEVMVREPLPNPSLGDVVLFLHIVPIMAAVAIRPQTADVGESTLGNMMNVLILLEWWVIVYALLVFPDQFVVTNVAAYNLRRDLLYVIEGMMLVGLSGWAFFNSAGEWRRLYAGIFFSGAIYVVGTNIIHGSMLRHRYASGGILDLPFLVALLGFLWVAAQGQYSLSETQEISPVRNSPGAFAPHLAKLAMLSLPVMGYWALFASDAALPVRKVRFAVAMGGVAILAFFVFFKQFVQDRRLVQLLQQSRRGYQNLQRLERRVVQQGKLASLGEMIALAAGELEYPLSAVLSSSEVLAASANLTQEQLATARKIGQQAWRTRQLVGDLLSFAQQTPGEQSPLELKPLLQRAVQMEGFKLENKAISLSVQSDDAVPRVLGNSNQLLQAFLQIVENAVDALQERGSGQLVVSLRRDRDEVVIEFADTGPGLREPERVFDPFYTTKPVGKGTGLGLSATYGVVQDHHGQITGYNRPEGGATFEIRLPALRGAAAAG